MSTFTFVRKLTLRLLLGLAILSLPQAVYANGGGEHEGWDDDDDHGGGATVIKISSENLEELLAEATNFLQSSSCSGTYNFAGLQ